MANRGSWDLFLKPTFQTDTWRIVTTRRFIPTEAAPGSFLSTYLAVAALSVLLILLLSLMLIRRIMVPLEKLMDGTRRIAHGDYQKIEVLSNDEFGDLTHAVNNMSEQIRQQLDTLQTLSDIDHEMRNRIDLKYMIKMVGSAMRRLLPSSTLYVARYRNDEFATDCLFMDYENAALIEQAIVISEDEIALLEQYPKGQVAAVSSFFPRVESHQQNWNIALIWQGRRCGALSLVWSTSKSMDAATQSTLIELANRVAIAIQIQEREQRLLHQALFDKLTGLLNRHGLEQKIVKIMLRNTPAAILFIDVDRFKLVNDSFGHKIGDQLLQAVAARIMTCNPECIGSRFGGDEFVLLLETNSNEEVTRIVRKLMALLVQPFTIGSQQLSITTSVGIALHPTHIRDGLTLIERADIAMYQAKRSGRNSYRFYSEHMSIETHQKLAMEESLRLALIENEFILHYQPKVDLASRKIVGAEALVRWNHPVKGLVFPAYFISLAEETSLIISLGNWVMREACQQNMRWRLEGYSDMRIAVNVSARQFNEPGFVETVEKILQETGLPADGLEIEVTESMLMNDIEQSIGILNSLSRLGVSLSIDDFGTGYSSLAYLKRFPINILKIDQSFVRDLVDDNDDRLIIASIIALAHNLQLRVVAEGVETYAQVDYLQKQQCDEIQGYYFSRPVAPLQFALMLDEEKMLPMLE
jgi:diguanylate cyclase (GGDEF)-like protein